MSLTHVGQFAAFVADVLVRLPRALQRPADVAWQCYRLGVGALPLVSLSESGGFYMRQGQPVMVPNAPRGGIVRVALHSGEFLGVGEILDDGRVAPRRLIVTGR